MKVRIAISTFEVSSHTVLHSDINAIQHFLHGMGQNLKLNISLTNEKLEAAMFAEMYQRKIQCRQLQGTLHLAASLVEVRRISYKLNCLTYHSNAGWLPSVHVRREESNCNV